MAKTFYIIDGHSQIYRAYYAPFRDLTSPAGEPTRATHVFCQMLLNFIRSRRPDYLAMAVDGPAEKLIRRRDYPEYKAHRPPMPDDLLPQVNRIMQIVKAMGIPILACEGHEADDIIATLADRFAGPDLRVIVVSRDKDLDQIVNPDVVLYDPLKDQTADAASILAGKGYPPEKAVEIQTLCGDATDNVPGVPGIGPKTAVKLVMQYGTADEVLKHADELTPKLCQNLRDNADKISLSRRLVTLDRSVPMDLKLDDMAFTGVRAQAVRPIFVELGLNRLIDQIDAAAGQAGGTGGGQKFAAAPAAAVKAQAEKSAAGRPAAAPKIFRTPATLFDLSGQNESPDAGTDLAEEKSPEKDTGSITGAAETEAGDQTPSAAPSGPPPTTAGDFDYRCIDTPMALNDLMAQLAGVKRIAVDTETTAVQPMWAELVGISLAWQPGKAFYIPVKGPMGSRVLDVALVREKLGPLLADPAVAKVGQNLKYDLIVLANAGMPVAGKMFDTMIAAHVLDSTRLSLKLDSLAMEFLNHRGIPIDELIGRGKKRITMDAVPVETVTIYASEDADVSLRLADVLAGKLADENLTGLFEDLEMPLMPVLMEMERTGVLLDRNELGLMEQEMSRQAEALAGRIVALAGRQFNIDSPKQLAAVLFDELHLPVARRTKTGPSTDSEVLEDLAASTGHELPALVLEYRRLTKLIGTYLKALAECIHPRTGRVHTDFHQTATVTGRLSSSDPNLQNIPIRTPEGRQIRRAFVASPGRALLSADYSQIELRILAHFCQDATLMKAFHDDQDVHRIVAAEVFGVPAGDVTPEQRARAKTVNFGIIYGQTAFGLARTLRISRADAGQFIQNYKKRFPQIDGFLESCIANARRDGYVQTVLGRRRRISGLDARNPSDRAASERLAINSTVQGSAADLIKRAMVNIARRIAVEKRPSRMLIQIHDELVFELPDSPDAVQAEREMIEREMTSAIKLSVPLKVDVGVGKNWMEAK
ncbi:MAG: DNA polymerase I [Planctomycetes bacterium]|nr:DNA polymerase I [Planctomycetota bacterium]